MKTEQEKIEEMAKNVKKFITECFGEHCQCCGIVEKCYPYYFSKVAYHFGYRKAREVIDEFVDRIKELLHKHEYRSQTDGVEFYQMNAESFCDEINELADEMRQEVEKCLGI